MANVKLQNVSKVYEGHIKAVNSANVFIEDKEFVVLVGPSGCGKSTLLRMIAGLEEITDGEIYIDEKLVNNVPPKDRDIAMVFQNYALYPHMSVYDNMAFGLKLRKFPKKEIKQRVQEAAEILEIQDFLDRKPKALSGGQRQRVAIGRAIVRKPKVFLFDEPLSNLDAKLRVQMRIEISRLHNQLQSTMVYVTHDQIEAMTMGDRIVVLKDGLVQQIDNPLSLYNKPDNLFVAGFIGSPAMNFIDGELEQKESLYFKSKTFYFSLPDDISQSLKEREVKNITLGVRPENIHDLLTSMDKKSLSTPQKVGIDVVEPIGNELYLYLNQDHKTICMRTTADRTYHTGDMIDVGFILNKLHFFETETAKKIA